MKKINIGLLSAMPEEIGNTLQHIKDIKTYTFGDLEIYSGQFRNEKHPDSIINLSIAWSGWGKVSAARAATRLISLMGDHKSLDLLLFTGVAGSSKSSIKQWDIIIPEELIQYDMDASPLFEKFVIPALNKKTLRPSLIWHEKITKSLKDAKKNGKLNNFGNIYKGLVGTGDRFISKTEDLCKIINELPELTAIEMEGASIAQVAAQEKIPYSIVRVISDQADDSAPDNFDVFIKKYNSFSWNLLEIIFTDLLEKMQ